MRVAHAAPTAVFLILSTHAVAQYSFEGFNFASNSSGWTFGGPSESIPSTGGNPGYYLRSSGLDTTVPLLRCGTGSIFTGNYRLNHVSSAFVDINIFSTDFNIGPFPLTVMLYSDNGTPADPNDDWAVFKLGDAIPTPGSGWKHFAFDIPIDSAVLPSDWGYIQLGPNAPAAADWNAVIIGVTRLEFSLGDPTLFYIFQMWTVGADNIGLSNYPFCYANCDQSTVPPILNVNDFQCFLNRFAAGDSWANCDASGPPPWLNAADFQCFLNHFAAGCS